MTEYEPRDVEAKWQEYWSEHGTFRTAPLPEGPSPAPRKFFALDMPFDAAVESPWRLLATDVVARYMRHTGRSVLYPAPVSANDGRPLTELLKLGISCDWERPLGSRRFSPEERFVSVSVEERLLEGLDRLEWPARPLREQRRLVGRREGVEVCFKLVRGDGEIPVFTSRPEAIFGAGFILLSANHPAVPGVCRGEYRKKVERFIADGADGRPGVFTGNFVANPATAERVPVYVGARSSGGEGSSAEMGVPAHDEQSFEYARQLQLRIRPVFAPEYEDSELLEAVKQGEYPWPGDGRMLPLRCPLAKALRISGMPCQEARRAVVRWMEGSGVGRVVVESGLERQLAAWRARGPLLRDLTAEAGWLPVDLYSIRGAGEGGHLLAARLQHMLLRGGDVVADPEPFEHLLEPAEGEMFPEELRFGSADEARILLLCPGARVDAGMLAELHALLTNAAGRVDRSDPPEVERCLRRTAAQVTHSIELHRFEAGIVRLAEFARWASRRGLSRAGAELSCILLAPFAPHLAEELWQQLGNGSPVSRAPWPVSGGDDAVRASPVVIHIGAARGGTPAGAPNAGPEVGPGRP